MPRLVALALFAPALLAAGSSLVTEEEEEALALDDECAASTSDKACSFNALQTRGIKSGQAVSVPSIKNSGQDCKAACGKEGFCQDYCGAGNACCDYYHRNAQECKLATFFPVVMPDFMTCVSTMASAPQSPPGHAAAANCKDEVESCAAWAKAGECKNNPGYMTVACCMSCNPPTEAPTPAPTPAPHVAAGGGGVAGGACSDKMQSCKAWAARGECKNSADFMMTNCCTSCSGGGGGGAAGAAPGDVNCKDSQAACPNWAQHGECERNSHWMQTNCKLSCKVCSPPAASTSPAGSPAPTGPAGPAAEDVDAAATTTPKPTAGTTPLPVWATTGCHTAKPGVEADKLCFDSVTWAYTDGLRDHPEWFEGLALNSPREAVQFKLNQDNPVKCPPPCAPSNEGCETVTSGACFQDVVFAKTNGIYSNPEWFPELTASSSVEDFQLHLHNQNATKCPQPCLKSLPSLF